MKDNHTFPFAGQLSGHILSKPIKSVTFTHDNRDGLAIHGIILIFALGIMPKIVESIKFNL
jgi:hypothetical protein